MTHHSVSLLTTLLYLLLALPHASAQAEESGKSIQLKKTPGRTWLATPEGEAFFAHGVTHISGRGRSKEDVTAIGEACKELGFNAYGYGCPPPLRNDLPFLESRNDLVPMSLYRTTDGSFGYVDIFDPEEQARLEKEIEKMCLASRENPKLIGYCWTDLGAWPLKNPTGKNWVDFIRELPAESPGQKAYAAFLETWKGDAPAKRDLAFLRLIAREYFRTLGEANRRFDPDHLIFGDRFSFQSYEPAVLEEMLPYVDAIAIQPSYQPGFPREKFDEIHQLSKKPILLCDFAIRFKEPGKTIRGWKPEENAAAAGKQYAAYVREAFATPYVLGVFWCNPINSKPGFQKQGIKQGLFDQGLKPRPELNRSILELNQFLQKETAKLDPSPEPATILDPQAWKITLPLPGPKEALEITNPDFARYLAAPETIPVETARYFRKEGDAYLFFCDGKGATTRNTEYPRCELREMRGNTGDDEYEWTLAEGGTLEMRFRIGPLAGGADKLIFAQIHGHEPEDKALLKCLWEKGHLRLLTKSGKKLDNFQKQQRYRELEEGEWHTLQIAASEKEIRISIDNEVVEHFGQEQLQHWPKNNSYYFKAGNYLQEKDVKAAATVAISALQVSHGKTEG